MKRKILVLVVLVLMPLKSANAVLPLTVFDAAAYAALGQRVTQIAYFGRMVTNQARSIVQFYRSAEAAVNQYRRALQNLRTAGDITSFGDFMDWYNRQLALERQAMQAFDNLSVRIGTNDVHFTDILAMRDAVDDTFIRYWDRQFTEEQRRAMWINLGLTPANYAWRQTFEARIREHQGIDLAFTEIEHSRAIRDMERLEQRMERVAANSHLDIDDINRLTPLELQEFQLEASWMTLRAMNRLTEMQARQIELAALKAAQRARIAGLEPLFSHWDEEIGFRPLVIGTPR